MSGRRPSKHQRRAWSRWIEYNRHWLADCGVWPPAYASRERWQFFLTHGYVENPRYMTGFGLSWLAPDQLRRLHHFIRREYGGEIVRPRLLQLLEERIAQTTEAPMATPPPVRDQAMTEGAWLTSSDPERMLGQVQGETIDRKLRLFGLACARRVQDAIPNAEYRQAVQVLERCADGMGTSEELRQMLAVAEGAEASTTGAARAAARAVGSAWSNAEHACSAAATAAPRTAAERQHQAELLREIFGTPYRPVAVDLSWLQMNEGLAGRIAQTIYEEERFTEMPILGDVLAEAGCQNMAILDHCRQSRGHVRGCWVLDNLLGVPVVQELSPRGNRFWTIKQPVEEEGKHIKQACWGSYARVTLLVEPVADGRPVLCRNGAGDSAGGRLPSVEAGISQFVQEQARAGIHLRGVRATLTGVGTHPLDSNGNAFKLATLAAIQQAMVRAGLARFGETASGD